MGVIKKFKLLLCVIIPIFGFFLMSQNTFAASTSLNAQYFEINRRDTPSGGYYWTTNIQYNTNISNVYSIKAFLVQNQSVIATGNYFSGSYKFIIRSSARNYQRLPTYFENIKVDALRIGSTYATNIASTVNMTPLADNIHSLVTVSFSGSITKNVSGILSFSVTSSSGDAIIFEQYTTGSGAYMGFQDSYSGQTTGGSIEFSDNINYINTINNVANSVHNLNSSVNETNNILNEQNDREQQGIDNISNQSSSDIQGSSDSKTDSLIGVISGFINAFRNINATDCSLTLEFPDYAGGSRIVDICSGKENAPRIIEIGSSLLLICVFVPLAFIMIRMIYNEIRSWTNG